MMGRYRYTLLFTVMIILAVIMNGLLFDFGIDNSNRLFSYNFKSPNGIFLNRDGEYFKYNTFKYKYTSENVVFDRKSLNTVDRVLAETEPDGYEALYRENISRRNDALEIMESWSRLSTSDESRQLIQTMSKEEAKYNIYNTKKSPAETEEQYRISALIANRIEKTNEYYDNISRVKESAEDLLAVPVFSDAVRIRLIKTSSDYAELKNVRIRAVSDEGIQMLFDDFPTDVIVLVTAVCCALFYSLRCREAIKDTIVMKSRYFIYITALAAGIFSIYFCNLIIINRYFPDEKMNFPVQSYHFFQNCPLTVSAGTVFLIVSVLKTAAALVVFFLFTGLFTAGKKSVYRIISLAVIFAELISERLSFPFSIFSVFRAEEYVGDYDITVLAGLPLQKSAIMTAVLILLLAVSAVVSQKCIRSRIISVSERAEELYFEEINAKYNESRQIRHDIRNHLSVIGILLDSGDVDGARDYIGEITGEIDRIKPPVRTGSGVLDALLLKKYTTAEKYNIIIDTVFLSDFSESGIRDYDLCGIFSNILDNAAEACVRLPQEKRKITLRVKDQMNMICIFCENSYTELNNVSGNFVTTKSDRRMHGIGLKRISNIAAKYGGTVDINTENNVFSISVLLVKQKNH